MARTPCEHLGTVVLAVDAESPRACLHRALPHPEVESVLRCWPWAHFDRDSLWVWSELEIVQSRGALGPLASSKQWKIKDHGTSSGTYNTTKTHCFLVLTVLLAAFHCLTLVSAFRQATMDQDATHTAILASSYFFRYKLAQLKLFSFVLPEEKLPFLTRSLGTVEFDLDGLTTYLLRPADVTFEGKVAIAYQIIAAAFNFFISVAIDQNLDAQIVKQTITEFDGFLRVIYQDKLLDQVTVDTTDFQYLDDHSDQFCKPILLCLHLSWRLEQKSSDDIKVAAKRSLDDWIFSHTGGRPKQTIPRRPKNLVVVPKARVPVPTFAISYDDPTTLARIEVLSRTKPQVTTLKFGLSVTQLQTLDNVREFFEGLERDYAVNRYLGQTLLFDQDGQSTQAPTLFEAVRKGATERFRKGQTAARGLTDYSLRLNRDMYSLLTLAEFYRRVSGNSAPPLRGAINETVRAIVAYINPLLAQTSNIKILFTSKPVEYFYTPGVDNPVWSATRAPEPATAAASSPEVAPEPNANADAVLLATMASNQRQAEEIGRLQKEIAGYVNANASLGGRTMELRAELKAARQRIEELSQVVPAAAQPNQEQRDLAALVQQLTEQLALAQEQARQANGQLEAQANQLAAVQQAAADNVARLEQKLGRFAVPSTCDLDQAFALPIFVEYRQTIAIPSVIQPGAAKRISESATKQVTIIAQQCNQLLGQSLVCFIPTPKVGLHYFEDKNSNTVSTASPNVANYPVTFLASGKLRDRLRSTRPGYNEDFVHYEHLTVNQAGQVEAESIEFLASDAGLVIDRLQTTEATNLLPFDNARFPTRLIYVGNGTSVSTVGLAFFMLVSRHTKILDVVTAMTNAYVKAAEYVS